MKLTIQSPCPFTIWGTYFAKNNPTVPGVVMAFAQVYSRTYMKGWSPSHLAGLSVGLSTVILIGMWMYDELSYDKYHQN